MNDSSWKYLSKGHIFFDNAMIFTQDISIISKKGKKYYFAQHPPRQAHKKEGFLKKRPVKDFKKNGLCLSKPNSTKNH